jgi:hypothetical protein
VQRKMVSQVLEAGQKRRKESAEGSRHFAYVEALKNQRGIALVASIQEPEKTIRTAC